MTDPPAIRIYAELLRNIRAINAIVSVQRGTFQNASACVDSDSTRLVVKHDGVERHLALPCTKDSFGETHPAIPVHLSKPSEMLDDEELTARIPLETRIEEDDAANQVPWNGAAISQSRGINCEQCRKSLVNTKTVPMWQDLPHDDWAEMMDLWHCHKPHDEPNGNDENAGVGKGYSAANGGVKAMPGMGYVGISYVLVSETDTKTTVKVSSAPPVQPPTGDQRRGLDGLCL
jgi:hypothetical protein